jgi:hypothetical protein
VPLVGGLRKYLQLQAQAKTGLSIGVLVCGLLAVVFGTLTAAFILLIAFIWLAERYEPLIAAAVLAGFFLLVTIIALFCSLWSRRRTIERAELALAARRQAAWFDPKLLAGAIQASRGIGWRRLLPLLALGILAASLGIERSKREGDSEQNGRRQLARAA